MILLNPFSRTVRTREGLPVLPGAFPLVGHVPALYRDLPAVLRRARAELGPMFWFTTGPGMWVLLCTGPESLEILKSPSFTSTHLEKKSPYVAAGTLLAQDGQAHRHMRGAMNKPFQPRGLSASRVGAMTASVLSALAARWADQKRIGVLAGTREAALEVIFRMIGAPPEDLPAWSKQYRELLLANYGINFMFPGSPAYRAARAHAWLNARFLSIIEAQRQNHGQGGEETLVAALANAKDDEGQPLTDMELTHNLRLLVLGGHETIASTMAWLVIALASRPELWDRLCEEAQRAPGVPTTPQEARAFPFAEALFRETVRMYPPFGVMTRMAAEDASLHGRRIPAGSHVAVDLWGISHDPAVFNDPDAFLPARWLDRSSPPTAIEISQFGAGPHFCLGYHLAWLEAVQIAVALAQELGRRGLRPRLAGGKAPRPIFVPVERPPMSTVVELV